MMQMGLTARAGSQSSRAQPGGGLTAMFFAPKGPDKNAAATRLQAAVRAHRARKVLQTHKWAATVVQAAARGQGARREAEQRRRTQAAVRIQVRARRTRARQGSVRGTHAHAHTRTRAHRGGCGRARRASEETHGRQHRREGCVAAAP